MQSRTPQLCSLPRWPSKICLSTGACTCRLLRQSTALLPPACFVITTILTFAYRLWPCFACESVPTRVNSLLTSWGCQTRLDCTVLDSNRLKSHRSPCCTHSCTGSTVDNVAEDVIADRQACRAVISLPRWMQLRSGAICRDARRAFGGCCPVLQTRR